MDLMKIITVSKMKQKITDYLIQNGKKYTQWYSGTLDNLVYDATEFFSTGNYNHDICDLMLKICSDSLDVNICVYQTGLWQDAIGNAYFHLDVTSLKADNQNINEEDITMEDDTFLQCKNSHMEYLHHLGYLEIVVRNKTT